MSTKVVPVPIGGCSGVMYNLGNYNYQCITLEEYNARVNASSDVTVLISLVMVLIACVVMIALMVSKLLGK